jgi:hypothetical protein
MGLNISDGQQEDSDYDIVFISLFQGPEHADNRNFTAAQQFGLVGCGKYYLISFRNPQIIRISKLCSRSIHVCFNAIHKILPQNNIFIMVV